MKKSLYMPLYGYYPSDPRVRKEVDELLSLNFDIHIVCLDQDPGTLPPGVYVHPVSKQIQRHQRESVPNLLLFWVLCFIFLLKQGRGLIIHAHDLSALPPAVLAKFIHLCDILIYDSHEFFPDAAKIDLGWIFGFFFYSLEKICMLYVDLLVGISTYQRNLFYSRYHKEMIVLPNYPKLTEIEDLQNQEPLKYDTDGFVIIAHGTVRQDRNYFELLTAFKMLKENNHNIHLVIIGDGPDAKAVQQIIKTDNLTNVHYIGKLPFSETFRYVLGADGAIGLVERTLPNSFGCSNKLYELIAAGIPSAYSYLVGSSIPLKKAKFILVQKNTPKSIYKSILELQNTNKDRFKNNFSLIQQYYNWEKSCVRLLGLYSQIFKIKA